MSKELFMAAHEEAIERYLEANPDHDWETAYDRTVDEADMAMRDMVAAQIDAARDRAKYGE